MIQLTEERVREIREAYAFLRKNNHSISDETLDYMLDVSLNPSKYLPQAGEGWMRVEDRLPESQQDVLFVLHGEVKLGTFWADENGKPDLWTYYDVNGTNRLYYFHEVDGITHWMPMPPPPPIDSQEQKKEEV